MTTLRDAKLRDLTIRLRTARVYTDVFGDERDMTAERLTTTYRNMARVVHPDVAGGDTALFQRLNGFKADADQMLAAGRYGEAVVLATIRTRKCVHTVTRKLGVTPLASLYETSTLYDAPKPVSGLLRVARHPRDNDLVAAEAQALTNLHATNDLLARAYPVLLDTFVTGTPRRRANVVVKQDGYTLAQLPTLFPDLDPRHVVWIWRKLLMALGFAHDQGLVHGAVLPPHLLVLPDVHGVVLLEWSYSVSDTPIKAVVNDYRDWYPEEVLKKKIPSAATDIAMAAHCMLDLLTHGPRPLRAFFKGCGVTRQSMRPQDAWELLCDFDVLLERMGEPYYPRRFVEFPVPPGTG